MGQIDSKHGILLKLLWLLFTSTVQFRHSTNYTVSNYMSTN